MKKVTVIGMDLGDKNHKAVGLSESGEEVERAEVPCTPEGVRAYLERHPGALLAIETGTHCRWVAGVAEELGREVLVGNARKLRVIWQTSRARTTGGTPRCWRGSPARTAGCSIR